MTTRSSPAPAQSTPSSAAERLRPMRGRAAEVNVIGSLMEQLVRGHGGVLIVEGPAGIGKSRLLAEARVMASAAGARTLSGHAFEYQQTVPFFPLFTATLHAEPPVGDATALRKLGGSADLHYWVVRDLNDAIGLAASETPLVILLEDVHWADTSTLLALRTLTARPHDSPVLWIMSARTGAGTPAVRDTVLEWERRGATFLRLSAMPQCGVIEMVEDLVRARADVSLLTLADKAHGNPFLVTELLGGLTEESRLRVSRGCAIATGNTLPQRLSATMRQRLDALTDETRETVQIAAVLPDRFTAVLLAQMLERRPTALVSVVDEAVRADLLVDDGDHLRFGHDLLREATRQSLAPSLRRAIERQSATVMMEMGATPAEVATQLVRSADVGDQEAVTALRAAAKSVANGDKSGAADLSRRALDLLPANDPQRGALVVETVERLNMSGRYQEADDLALAMLGQLSPEEEAQARLRTPKAADAVEERVAENRRALQLGQISDLTRSRHLAWLACNHAVSGLPIDESILAEAVAAAEATGDVESTTICETAVAIMDYVDGQALRALNRIESLRLRADGGDQSFASTLADYHRANMLTFLGRSDEATTTTTHGMETARREGNEMASVLWVLQSAAIDLARGRLSGARATLEAVPAPLWGAMSEISMHRWMILADIATHVGDRQLLQDVVVEARSANPLGTTLVSVGAAYVLALSAWDCGDVHEAVRWLSADTLQVFNPLWMNPFDKLILTARVSVAAGDAGLRARVLRSLDLLEVDRASVPLFAAAIQHTRGILERDAAAMADAAGALRGVRPLLSACAAEDAGVALARTGTNACAVEQFNFAFDAYVGSEAAADARRVAHSLRRLGVERRISTRTREKTGWDSLTDAELKVVNLIADGATNPIVAQRLHLSPNTVKSHVRSAFAKLGITSRTQLTGLLSVRDTTLKDHPPGDGGAVVYGRN